MYVKIDLDFNDFLTKFHDKTALSVLEIIKKHNKMCELIEYLEERWEWEAPYIDEIEFHLKDGKDFIFKCLKIKETD